MRTVTLQINFIVRVLPLNQNLFGWMRFVAQESQRFVRGAVNVAPRKRRQIGEPVADQTQFHRVIRRRRDFVEHIQRLIALFENRREESVPRSLAKPFDGGVIFLFNSDQFLFG